MSGIIGISPDMKSGVIGAWPSDNIIKHHEFTTQYQTYNNLSASAWLTTGNGWSGTTSSQTSKLIVFATGTTMAYFATGASLANGGCKLVFHSDSTTKGATPSGADLGSTTTAGGYTVGLASGRKDLYLSWTICTTADVSPSTAYHIQVATLKYSGNYFNMEPHATGYVQEVR